jgi:hypothetical protein
MALLSPYQKYGTVRFIQCLAPLATIITPRASNDEEPPFDSSSRSAPRSDAIAGRLRIPALFWHHYMWRLRLPAGEMVNAAQTADYSGGMACEETHAPLPADLHHEQCEEHQEP